MEVPVVSRMLRRRCLEYRGGWLALSRGKLDKKQACSNLGIWHAGLWGRCQSANEYAKSNEYDATATATATATAAATVFRTGE